MSRCKWSSRCGGCIKIDRDINEELAEKTEYIITITQSSSAPDRKTPIITLTAGLISRPSPGAISAR